MSRSNVAANQLVALEELIDLIVDYPYLRELLSILGATAELRAAYLRNIRWIGNDDSDILLNRSRMSEDLHG